MEMRSRTDYIMGYDRQIFQNVVVQDPRHNSGHYMFMGCLCGASPMDHSYYHGRRIRLPLCLPVRQTRTQANNIFSEFRRDVPKPDKYAGHNNSWIFESMWTLVYDFVYVTLVI